MHGRGATAAPNVGPKNAAITGIDLYLLFTNPTCKVGSTKWADGLVMGVPNLVIDLPQHNARG
jgi:hypothetical protein